MKLFRFPVLVFDNVIKQFDTIALVSLSFCSKKTRGRVKKVSLRIKGAWFGNDDKKYRGYDFAVQFPLQHFLYVSFRPISKEFKKRTKKFSARIGDISYEVRYLIESKEPDRNDIYLGCIGHKKASIFFNYILDLVRAGITDIGIDLNINSNTKQFLSEPCFKNVQRIALAGKKSSPGEKVTELYECFQKPILETVVKCHIKSFSSTSKLLQSENLLVDPSKFISIEHLLNFTGKYIVLNFSSLLEEHINLFVKHWLDGNYPNLEGAVITCSKRFVFEPEKVLNEFNTKRWNPSERAQNFMFKASFSRDEKNEFSIIDCSNGHDLERSDGLLATIEFEEHGHFFNFFVWHTRFP